MRTTDIIKLAQTNRFEIFKLNATDDKFYCLKRMTSNDKMPSWEVIAQELSFDVAMTLYHDIKSRDKYPLLYWKEFSTFDILAIINCGFRIWKETYDYRICIQEFDINKLKWNIHKTFDSLQEKNIYLNKELIDQRTIVID